MRRADVSVQFDQRKAACVLEPALLLSRPVGPMLALRLSAVLEPWLTRSFWQILDSSDLLGMQGFAARSCVDAQALQRWLAFRERTDSADCTLRWLGDRFAESRVDGAADFTVMERFEVLLEGLQTLHARLPAQSGPASRGECALGWPGIDMAAGALDGLALSAVLEGAALLCELGSEAEPGLVTLARRMGLPVRAASEQGTDSLFLVERRVLREAMARAGAAPMLQALPGLAVVHAWVDEDASTAATPLHTDPTEPPSPCACRTWAGAQLWWYAL